MDGLGFSNHRSTLGGGEPIKATGAAGAGARERVWFGWHRSWLLGQPPVVGPHRLPGIDSRQPEAKRGVKLRSTGLLGSAGRSNGLGRA